MLDVDVGALLATVCEAVVNRKWDKLVRVRPRLCSPERRGRSVYENKVWMPQKDAPAETAESRADTALEGFKNAAKRPYQAMHPAGQVLEWIKTTGQKSVDA